MNRILFVIYVCVIQFIPLHNATWKITSNYSFNQQVIILLIYSSDLKGRASYEPTKEILPMLLLYMLINHAGIRILYYNPTSTKCSYTTTADLHKIIKIELKM